ARQYASISKLSPHKKFNSGGISQLSYNWVRLNMDDLIRVEKGFAVASGLVRDHNGGWMFDFGRYLGNFIVLECELWGILDCLKLISDHCLEGVLIQTDCLEVVNAI
ncbi:hypothetical protein Golax_010355, partial [Gossypium laxum]|nr:hypothetical protein [Gossypium laxum]